MDIYEIAQNIFSKIENEVNATTKWKSTSKYAKIRHLQIDKRGSFGERLLRDVFAKEKNISLRYADGDYIAFIGVAPDELFMRFEKISEIDFSKLHNRGKAGTGAGYKWDFKPENMTSITTREDVVRLIYQKLGFNKKRIKKEIKG